MFKRLLRLPLDQNNSIFLFGPRGTGKTSWLKTYLTDVLYFDLLDFSLYQSLFTNPNRLDNLIPPGYNNWIIIDEVQRIPELLNEVHRLIEHKKYKFILTGSSARSLKRSGVNLLAGRALKYTMHPLVIQELDKEFDLKKVLEYGLLPSVIEHPNPKKYLESYVQTYIQEEVLQEGLTRNIGNFSRFLEAASFSQGQVLNTTEIGRELGINRLTIANYFDILDDLLLGIRISTFSQRAKRKIIAHQKFYFFDAGVYNTLRPVGPLDSREELDGAALETLFFQSLSAINDYYQLQYKIHFWRTVAGDEVDFIIYGPRGFHAFEIKRSATLTGKALSGLKKFGDDYPEAKLYILFLGKQKEYYGNITALPLKEALRELPDLIK